MRVTFIGFGGAARAFRTSLAARDCALSFAAHDVADPEAMAGAMAKHGVKGGATPAEHPHSTVAVALSERAPSA